MPERGHILIDVAAGLKPSVLENTEIESPAWIANSSVETGWTFKYDLGTWEIEPRHYHYYADRVRFRNSDIETSYDFVAEVESPPPFLGMADRDHAIIFDRPNVIIWNLRTGQQFCIAHAESAFVWPRNLHLPERYAPKARCEKEGVFYQWTLSSPTDIVPKADYIIRK